MTSEPGPAVPKVALPIRERAARLLALFVFNLYEPLAATAFGVGIGVTEGWVQWLMASACAMLLVNIIMSALLRARQMARRKEAQLIGGVLEINGVTATLDGESAKQVHDLIQTLATKQERSSMN
jgi:hypothetical protein